MRLRGRFPLKLITVPTDPISGDGAVGAAMMKGEFVHRGETVPIQSLSFANAEASAETRDWLQSFAWLRDLAASSPRPEAARLAEPLTRLLLADRKSVAWGKSVSGRVGIGGSRFLKKNTL